MTLALRQELKFLGVSPILMQDCEVSTKTGTFKLLNESINRS
jgi:hypothetical protein